MWKLESILDFMKKHPIKAYSYAYSQCQYVWEERSSISCLNEYIHDWWYYHTHKLIGNIQYKILKHKCFKFVRKLTQYNYILIQQEDNWSPRFMIVLRRKDEYDYDKDRKPNRRAKGENRDENEDHPPAPGPCPAPVPRRPGSGGDGRRRPRRAGGDGALPRR